MHLSRIYQLSLLRMSGNKKNSENQTLKAIQEDNKEVTE